MLKNHEVNLHTHTARCKHAKGCVKEYCMEAVKAGLKVLGFAEHSAFPDDRLGATRMFYKELEEYRNEVEEAKKLFPDLIILAGLEVDTHKDFPLSFYEKELKERLDLDFMAAGVHFVHDENGEIIHAGVNAHHSNEIIKLFADKTIFLMESGLFDFITHPDMVAASIDCWNGEIEKVMRNMIESSIKNNIPLEINAYGLRKSMVTYPDGTRRHPYPFAPFWDLFAQYDIAAVAGSDAHDPSEVYGNLPEVFAFGEERKIPFCNDLVAEKILKRRSFSCGK